MVFIDDKADAINALIEAVEAIEYEMGITPSGVYSDVRVRLDILEARINNPFAPAPNVENPFIIGNDGVTISTGTGYPTENRLPGSLYLRKDGYNNEGLYARRPDMMWHQIDTDPWTANRDLAGTIYSQTVIGLQDHDINPDASLLQTDAVGDGYVLTWNDTANAGNGWWEPQIGFFPFGDLSGNKINQTVINIQGYQIVMGSLGSTQDGYSLIWNNTVPRWEPQRLAVVFQPLDNGTTTNIRSNRYVTQSPIDGTKSGIVNLGSDTSQLTVGVNANFGTILGGDKNRVSADYGTVVGGSSNSVLSTYGFIGGGRTNIILAGESLSFIGGGDTNTVDGYTSSVVGGLNNNVVGNSSNILGGELNNLTGNWSSILGGTSNVQFGNHAIVFGSANIGLGNNSILFGSSNQVSGSVNSNYTSVLGGASNNVIATDPASYLHIIGGTLNTLRGTYNTILNGNSNTVTTATSYATILGGNNNSVDGYYNVILGGVSNSIISSIHSIVSGNGNSVSSSYSVVAGLTNTVAAGTNNFVTIYGDLNVINSGSHYTGVWGCSNTTNDGYIALFGDHNTMNAGSTYADVHGDHNTIGNSKYTSIWGDNNNIGNASAYAAIFGNLNTIGGTSPYSCVYGSGNNIGAGSTYSYVNGLNNTLTTNAQYSSAWGQSNNVGGYYANTWGQSNVTAADWTTVFGYYGKASVPGQFSISSRAINNTTAGASQYSKIILDGTQVAGGQFDLVPYLAGNLSLENGKCYDMTIRVLINNTTGSPTCARYVLDVLAHCEAGTLTLDVVNTTIANDNGTGWTVSLLTSGNQLIVRVNSSGTLDRRAIATVDWRELSRT